MLVCYVGLELGGCIESLGLEYVDDVAAGDDDDGMAVFADFGVGLGVEVGRGDQDAELAVAQPGDQPVGCADANAVAGCEALKSGVLLRAAIIRPPAAGSCWQDGLSGPVVWRVSSAGIWRRRHGGAAGSALD
jgi:hypothetical protein